jgi:hypothetical protein
VVAVPHQLSCRDSSACCCTYLKLPPAVPVAPTTSVGIAALLSFFTQQSDAGRTYITECRLAAAVAPVFTGLWQSIEVSSDSTFKDYKPLGSLVILLDEVGDSARARVGHRK